MFDVARPYVRVNSSDFVKPRDQGTARDVRGDTALHQPAEVGAISFDRNATLISGGFSSTMARRGDAGERNLMRLVVSPTRNLTDDYVGDLGFQVCRQPSA
jgi:hypothetical protein